MMECYEKHAPAVAARRNSTTKQCTPPNFRSKSKHQIKSINRSKHRNVAPQPRNQSHTTISGQNNDQQTSQRRRKHIYSTQIHHNATSTTAVQTHRKTNKATTQDCKPRVRERCSTRRSSPTLPPRNPGQEDYRLPFECRSKSTNKRYNSGVDSDNVRSR